MEEKYRIHLDNFDGPLDLLLHLIDKNKLDIYDIPIHSVTEQYMAFLSQAKELNLEIASEFLVIAATLINIKVKMLLPKKITAETEEEDPREELVARLLEYKFYKEAAQLLKASAQSASGRYIREIDVDALAKNFTPTNPVANITIRQLMESFQKVLQHIKEEPPILELSREEYDIEDLMGEMLVLLNQEKALKFSALFASQTSKRRVITMFLAILELLKAQQITFVQRENFDELWLFARTADEEVG